MKSELSPRRPLFFLPNRVWRCYTGGALMDRFTGAPHPADTHCPEDWLASAVRALNGPNSQGPEEGLSRVRRPGGQPGPLLADLIAADPMGYLGRCTAEDGLGLLCKYLDSAVRLPIQCHPDRTQARELYHSEHGKAESWFILDTRVINRVEPYLLMGFKPGVTPEAFKAAIFRQDSAAMETMLNRVPVKPGDLYFLPGRFPHAIGSGVFMLEVQEPSDWVIQPEATCAGAPLTESDKWGPLAPEVALAVFDYTGMTVADIQHRLRLTPEPAQKFPEGILERLIGPKTTDCFGLDLLTVRGAVALKLTPPFHVGVVVRGTGWIEMGGDRIPVRQGQVYFMPYGVRQMTVAASPAPLAMALCFPGK